jgi:hypothetical protein
MKKLTAREAKRLTAREAKDMNAMLKKIPDCETGLGAIFAISSAIRGATKPSGGVSVSRLCAALKGRATPKEVEAVITMLTETGVVTRRNRLLTWACPDEGGELDLAAKKGSYAALLLCAAFGRPGPQDLYDAFEF